jgi:hypothetical protein
MHAPAWQRASSGLGKLEGQKACGFFGHPAGDFENLMSGIAIPTKALKAVAWHKKAITNAAVAERPREPRLATNAGGASAWLLRVTLHKLASLS